MSRVVWKTREFVRKNTLSNVILVGSSVVGLAHYIKHSVLVNYYKKYIELHGKNGAIESSENLKHLVEEVKTKDLKEFASEFTPVVPVLVPGLNTINIGVYGTVIGGVIGLPAFVDYKSKEELHDNISITTNSFDEKDFEELYDCFWLTEKAKKYIIAHEILLINTPKVYLHSVLPITIGVFMDYLIKNLSSILPVLSYSLLARVAFNTSVIVFVLALWRSIYINIHKYYESEVESIIAGLNSEYIEGALEYCNKAVQRNSLQVELKDQQNRILKSIDDFVGYLFFLKGLPFELKRDYFKAHLEMNKKNTA